MGSQIHNTAPGRKAELRRRAIDALGGPSEVSVLETHSGPAEMRRRVYSDVRDWLGIDKDPSSPMAIHADSRHVLRAMPIDRFNLFDVDSFGSPWEHVWIIGQRLSEPSEEFGVVVTDGAMGGMSRSFSPSFRMGGYSRHMVDALGASPSERPIRYTSNSTAPTTAAKLLDAFFPRHRVAKLWSGTNGCASVRYFAAIMSSSDRGVA